MLPYANQTGDAGCSYVADALTTAITSDLSRIRGAVIVPSATAASLQTTGLTVRQWSSEAYAHFVLSGAVASSGERVRVHAQLADARENAQL